MEPYSEAVRKLFAKPRHGGVLSRDYPYTLSASASESVSGAEVHLACGIVDDQIAEMRFQAFACPHLIAAAEALCKAREGNAVASLSVFALDELMTGLAVPVEKTGRILLLEDAQKSLWAKYSGADQAG